jgi:large subunit ribosomal protein L35
MEVLEMPKIKTNRGAAKRFKTTGSGKIVRNKAFSSHILTKKSTKRKRNLRKSGVVHSTNKKNVARLVPYL